MASFIFLRESETATHEVSETLVSPKQNKVTQPELYQIWSKRNIIVLMIVWPSLPDKRLTIV